MALKRQWLSLVLVVAVCLASIVGAQALATASAPVATQLSQSRIVGQAGFAYLGGLRVMLAGLLYQRIDPQYHQYMYTKKIQDRNDLLPSIRIIQMLNPQLEQPYYCVSFILALKGRVSDGVALAKQGVENNPQSGLLRANYAQLLIIQDKKGNLPEMLRQAKAGLSNGATFTSIDDQFESYGIFKAVYKIAGNAVMVAKLQAAEDKLEAAGAKSASGGGGTGFGALVNSWVNSAASSDN